MSDFILRALLGGIGVAVIAGPLGALVVWRRMAYFGDSLSHAALLGVALGFLFHVDLSVSVMLVCVVVALLLVWWQGQQRIASDTLLGILAHSTLALGLVVLALLEGVRVDLMAYLFGDILAISSQELWWGLLGAVLVLSLLAWLWSSLLAVTLHEELAQVEGVPVTWLRIAFVLLVAVVIALAMKVVGILLITSLLIIPAATARHFARTPEQMAVGASVCGALAVVMGVLGSLQWDIPTGPAIVVAAALLFILSSVLPLRQRI